MLGMRSGFVEFKTYPARRLSLSGSGCFGWRGRSLCMIGLRGLAREPLLTQAHSTVANRLLRRLIVLHRFRRVRFSLLARLKDRLRTCAVSFGVVGHGLLTHKMP
jgi:hypothetical protein